MAMNPARKAQKKTTHKVAAIKGPPPRGAKQASPPPAGKLQQVAFGWFADTPKAPPLGKAAKVVAPKKTAKAKGGRALPARGGGPKGDVVTGGPREDQMPGYLVAFRGLMAEHDLALWFARYLKDEVAGIQAANTLEGKVRDFKAFLEWIVATNGHASLAEWLPRDTQSYVRHLISKKRAPVTINRHLATIRRFARWVQDQPGGLLQRHGSPIRGIKDLSTDEPECKKLDANDVHRVFRAADKLVNLNTRTNARPRRNRAILSLLYYTGLRVSELTGLHMGQLKGKHLVNVRRKGRTITKQIYLVTPCQQALLDYFDHERHLDAKTEAKVEQALFLARAGAGISRGSVGIVLREIAAEASKKCKEPIDLHPHSLRHTFGALFREKSGSDTETAAALGHTGLAHVRRYVRKSQKEREEAMDAFFE